MIAIFYRKDEDKGGYHGSFVTVSRQEGPFQSVSCLNDVWDVRQVKVSLPSPLQWLSRTTFKLGTGELETQSGYIVRLIFHLGFALLLCQHRDQTVLWPSTSMWSHSTV